MKLKALAIDGNPNQRNVRLENLASGLSIVYGESGSGKSTIRQIIRDTLMGLDSIPMGSRGCRPVGDVTIVVGDGEFRLSRNRDAHAQLNIHSVNSTADSVEFKSILDLPNRVVSSLYETVFNVSFRNTPTNIYQLASVLQNHLGVTCGVADVSHDWGVQDWKRELDELSGRLDSVKQQITTLNQQEIALTDRDRSMHHERHLELARLESQINQNANRIREINLAPVQAQLLNLQAEIDQARLLTQQQREEAEANSRIPNRPSALYARLDEIEDQIRCWRSLQTEIQTQRVQLHDEMSEWNDLTLESSKHPYHQARSILVAIESKVDQAERHANHWSDAGGPRVDTTQMTRSLAEICQNMRGDLQGLCTEMENQYKHMRHKSAAVELKRLRRFYSEMGQHLEQLILRRVAAIDEIRSLAPLDADAIARAEFQFCESALRHGNRKACIQFVPAAIQDPYVESEGEPLPGYGRLAQLELQRDSLNSSLTRSHLELDELNGHQAEMIRRRERLGAAGSAVEESQDATTTVAELQRLNLEHFNLQSRIDRLNASRPHAPHAILKHAGELLAKVTHQELSHVFLDGPITLATQEVQFGIQIREKTGNIVPFSAIDPGLQDQVYLCLILAVKEHLKLNRIEMPSILDDAFLRIPRDRVSATLDLLNEFGAQGHQIIAMTQHRYLADRIPGLPVFELPPPLPATSPPATPERSPAPLPFIFPNRESDWTRNRFFEIGNGLASPATPPYPLSKYNADLSITMNDNPAIPYAVHEPRTEAASHFPSPIPNGLTPGDNSTSTVSISAFADPVGLVPGIDDATRLDHVGLFEPVYLRTFSEHGIVSVSQMLSLHLNQSKMLGIQRDQLQRWQSQVRLLWSIPGLRIDDARILVACGFHEPEQLDTSHVQQIEERINRFLTSNEGRHWAVARDPISVDRIEGWCLALDATRSRWRNRTPADLTDRVDTPQTTHSQNPAHSTRIYSPLSNSSRDATPVLPSSTGVRGRSQGNPSVLRERRAARPPRMNTPTTERKMNPLSKVGRSGDLPTTRTADQKAKSRTGSATLKFHLDLADHIEAAPSIGPKTAERFEKIGVATVDDFLKQTAESLAKKIDFKRISTDVVRQWQQQARLICRIPNLRNHDAQLLVACNVWEPEDLASMHPKTLLEVIGPFSKTKEGRKIIRNGKNPDLAEITSWIQWATQMRSIQAA